MKLLIMIAIGFVIALCFIVLGTSIPVWEKYDWCKYFAVYMIWILCSHVYYGVEELIQKINDLKQENRILRDDAIRLIQYIKTGE